MKGRVAGLAAAALLAGCGGPNVRLQDLLSLPVPAETQGETAGETGAKNGTGTAATTGPESAPVTASLSARPEPHETSALVSGTPTGIFAEVARGALGCWFAADGPLKASHIYRAEAEPPAKGGDAEIVIYERDASMRDLRGPRAYRIAFTAEVTSVRVTMTALRLEPKLAQAMAMDVGSWARGKESCRLRPLLPPPPVASKASKTAKGQSGAKGKTTARDKKR